MRFVDRRRFLAFMAAAASWSGARTAFTRTVTDATGAAIEVSPARRIVSIGSDVTETIYALGEGSRVVAVDSTSNYPDAARQLPNVGYMRSLSAEGVLSVAPDLILANAGAGPPETIGALRASGIPFAAVPDGLSPAGVCRKVTLIGSILDVDQKAEALAASVGQEFARLANAVSRIDRRPRVMFILSLGSGRIIAAGARSSAAAMMALAGAENALDGFDGYKPVSEEAVISAQPEAIIMMMSRALAPEGQAIFDRQPFAATPAARDRRLISMDGAYLLAFGPRSPAAARDLAHALHPDADLSLAR
jgi:iron complex transport system substrate-binding protein